VHPLIRLLSFMVFAAFVSLGQTASSIIGLSMLVVVWLVSKQFPAPKAWLMIKRLRIFFISIFIMYLWFTPGQLIWPVLEGWSPTYDGLFMGLQRVAALIILVLGVESLLRLTDRLEIIVGLYYLATPFKCLGIDRKRFVIRVLLTLEAAGLPFLPEYNEKFEFKNVGRYLEKVSEHLAEGFGRAVDQKVDMREMEIEIKALPGWIQWLIPFSMAVLFLNVG